MAQDTQQLYTQLEPLIQRQITRNAQMRDYNRQYTISKIPVHVHNNSDSPRVDFTDLHNVETYVLSTTVTITVAQITSLFTTPIVLIPAPSKRQVIIVHSVTARLTYGATPYTGTHNLEIHYTDGNGTQVTDSIPASFINSTSSAFYHAPAVASSFVPIEGGTGKNGQIVAFVNTANPGGNVFTATGPISSGATTATLTSPWAGTTGVYTVRFSNGEEINVTFTNGSSTIIWTDFLFNLVTATLTLTNANSTITLVTHYHLVSFQT